MEKIFSVTKTCECSKDHSVTPPCSGHGQWQRFCVGLNPAAHQLCSQQTREAAGTGKSKSLKLFPPSQVGGKAERDWLVTVMETFSWRNRWIIFPPVNATREVGSCDSGKLHVFSQTLLFKLPTLNSIGLCVPGAISCASRYLSPLWHTVDKLTQTMPSPHFHTDYRHLLQINKKPPMLCNWCSSLSTAFLWKRTVIKIINK